MIRYTKNPNRIIKIPLIISLFCLPLQQNVLSDTIRIGLLVQDKQSIAAKQGAELAIRDANLKETSGKRYYTLEVRNMEGPWGTGAKESVNLVFKERVRAVIGSIDGRNSHLAEQVSAKTTIPFISAWSGDPTLGQAFIPWFFSSVPNDMQAAEIIFDEIRKKGIDKIAVVSDIGYDSKMSVSAVQKKYAAEKRKEPDIYYYSEKSALGDISGKLPGYGCVIFFGYAGDLSLIIKSAGKMPVIFAPYLLMSENFREAIDLPGEIMVINPGPFLNNKEHPFTTSFVKKYGIMPGPLSAYAYDAVSFTLESIKKEGSDSASLYRHISGIRYKGVTGDISFDKYGNRKVLPGLIKITGGKPAAIEH